jgi:hypothetical protein
MMTETITDEPSTPTRPLSSARRSRDFIIKGKSPSVSGSLHVQKEQEKQRKQISGLGAKPHTLSKQNEAI